MVLPKPKVGRDRLTLKRCVRRIEIVDLEYLQRVAFIEGRIIRERIGKIGHISYTYGVARSTSTSKSELYDELRFRITEELTATGFIVKEESLELPEGEAKNTYRKLHRDQRTERLNSSVKTIAKWEALFLSRIAKPEEIDINKIDPQIRPLQTEQDRGIFNYACLTWSVPVSKGFGRRMYFLVEDRQNGKLIGIFALGDPVYNLSVRDKTIGWTQEQKAKRLYNVFDAFVCGAIDPYRKLLGGKLIAMLTTSEEVIELLRQKYDGKRTQISEEIKDSRPALITVTSALGRSSIYNRLKLDNRYLFRSCGYTKGYGHFHFSPSLYADLLEIAKEHPHYAGTEFGEGANWKIRTLKQALTLLGVSNNYMQHGLAREVYLGELAAESLPFLRGETNELLYHKASIREISDFWKKRWIRPRKHLLEELVNFDPQDLRISKEIGLELPETIF
jgi:hypothetical protein